MNAASTIQVGPRYPAMKRERAAVAHCSRPVVLRWLLDCLRLPIRSRRVCRCQIEEITNRLRQGLRWEGLLKVGAGRVSSSDTDVVGVSGYEKEFQVRLNHAKVLSQFRPAHPRHY